MLALTAQRILEILLGFCAVMCGVRGEEMWFPLVFGVTAFYGIIDGVVSNCNIQDKRTTCITEDLLEMLMRMNTKEDSSINLKPAFFAGLKNNYALTGSNEILEFDVVQFNRGEGYNPSTGVFTAPMDGIYQFSCTIIAGKSGTHVGYQLNKNDTAYVLGYSPVVSNVASSTVNAVMKMTKGDRAFIKHRHNSVEYVQGSLHSTFAGYFIYE